MTLFRELSDELKASRSSRYVLAKSVIGRLTGDPEQDAQILVVAFDAVAVVAIAEARR